MNKTSLLTHSRYSRNLYCLETHVQVLIFDNIWIYNIVRPNSVLCLYACAGANKSPDAISLYAIHGRHLECKCHLSKRSRCHGYLPLLCYAKSCTPWWCVCAQRPAQPPATRRTCTVYSTSAYYCTCGTQDVVGRRPFLSICQKAFYWLYVCICVLSF